MDANKIIALFNIDEIKSKFNVNKDYSILSDIQNAFVFGIPIIIINSQDSISGTDKHLQHFIRSIVENKYLNYFLLSKTDATKKKYSTSYNIRGISTILKKAFNVRTRIYVNSNIVNIIKENPTIIKLINSYGKNNNTTFNENSNKKINILEFKRKRFTSENDTGKYGGGKIGYELVYTITDTLNKKNSQKITSEKQTVFIYNFAEFKQNGNSLNILNQELNLKYNISIENVNNTYIFVASKNGIYIPSYEIKKNPGMLFGKYADKLDKIKSNTFIPFNNFNKDKKFEEHFKQFYIKQLQYTVSTTTSNGNNNGNETINPLNNITVGKPIGPGKKNLNNEVNSLIELYNEMKNLGYFSNKKKKEDYKSQIKQNYDNLNPIQKLLFLAWYIDNVENLFKDNIFKYDNNNKNNDIIIVLNELSQDFSILTKINNDIKVIRNIDLIQKYIDINLNSNFFKNENKKAQIIKNIIKEIEILNNLYKANIILFKRKGLIE